MGSPITFWVILLLFILLGFPQKLKISPYCLSVTLNKLTFPDSGRIKGTERSVYKSLCLNIG